MAERAFRTKVKLNTEDMSVDVEIINNQDDTVAESEVFLASEIHESVRSQVALYGLSKLLQDRASDTKVGPEKIAAMRAVLSQLAGGEWARERKIGAIVVSAEVEALARIKNVTVPQIQAALKSYPKEARQKILGHDSVQELAATIKTERAEAETVDLGDLMEVAQEGQAEATA